MTLDDYQRLLFNLRQQVVDGSPWISRAASNFDIDHFELRSGGDPARRGGAPRLPDARTRLRRDRRLARRVARRPQEHRLRGAVGLHVPLRRPADPVGLLGAMFIIEGLGAKRAAGWAARFQEVLGLRRQPGALHAVPPARPTASTPATSRRSSPRGIIDDAAADEIVALRTGRRPALRTAARRAGSLTWRSSSAPTRACGRRSTPTPRCRSTAHSSDMIIDDQRRLSRRWLYPIARVVSRVLVALISIVQARAAVPVDAAAHDGRAVRVVPAAVRLARRRRAAHPALRRRDQPRQLHHPQHRPSAMEPVTLRPENARRTRRPGRRRARRQRLRRAHRARRRAADPTRDRSTSRSSTSRRSTPNGSAAGCCASTSRPPCAS